VAKDILRKTTHRATTPSYVALRQKMQNALYAPGKYYKTDKKLPVLLMKKHYVDN
jgi:hypothetical protein